MHKSITFEFMTHTLNIYQVFTRLFRVDSGLNKPFGTIEENGCSKFEHFSNIALKELKNMGLTHIWFTGVLRHATCTNYDRYGVPSSNPLVVKGRAGSPYAINDYYDVNPDLAVNPANRMEEFEALVNRCHENGLKVIIDFVPNHVARQYRSVNQPDEIGCLGQADNIDIAFDPLNNFYYTPQKAFQIPEGIYFPYALGATPYSEFPARATGNDAFTPNPNITDWYETIKLNYGIDYLNGRNEYFNPIPDTWHKMQNILSFWAKKGIDGFRCDMAEMVPTAFWAWVIPQIKEIYKSPIFIAEVYKPGEYLNYLNAGFDYLYDKVGLYDILRALTEGNGSAKEITFLWQRYEGFNHKMLRFLENHDEQRIASHFFANNPANAIPAMVLSATLHKGPLMIYFGQEIGEKALYSEGFSGYDGRTSIFDYWRIEEYQKWVNNGKFDGQFLNDEQKQLRNFYIKLCQLRLQSETISQGGFYDLMWVNSDGINTDKIYAFIRYFKNEVLLIVCNFDRMNGYSINLRIPNDAITISQLPNARPWQAFELLNNSFNFEIDPNQASSNGFHINLEPNQALIFKLH